MFTKKSFTLILVLSVGIVLGDRTIYLEKFFKKRYLRINLFDKDINYNSGNHFKNRLLKIDNFLKMVYENKNFNLSFDELKNWLIL